MKRIRKPYPLIVLALLIAWILRPYPAIDDAKVHPAFHGFSTDVPFDRGTSFADGGSSCFVIYAPKGDLIISIPHLIDDSNRYQSRFYFGAAYYTDPKAVEVTGYKHTRWKLAKILSQQRWSDTNTACEIAYLTGRVSDWIAAGMAYLINER